MPIRRWELGSGEQPPGHWEGQREGESCRWTPMQNNMLWCPFLLKRGNDA